MSGKERFSIFISQSVTGLIKVIYHSIYLFLSGIKWKLISHNLRQSTSISLSFPACFQLVWDLKCFAQEERRTRIYPWMSCSTARWSEATEWPSPLTPLTKCESRCNPTIAVSDDAPRAVTKWLGTNFDAVAFAGMRSWRGAGTRRLRRGPTFPFWFTVWGICWQTAIKRYFICT